ncbi:hypothetical protein GGG16DRAFT_12520, partial [Schizophyllum commune]
MCAADRAYYGVYTPSCPIQPDSLRNRVHGAATCSSSLGKDDLILYESGLGKRKANAIEFAHYLEGLAKEMQPVLDTLVRATVADDELAPEAWQFELEMQKHARSLKEARNHSDLSFAHIAASWQCTRAVHFYRKYRKQAEDLAHSTAGQSTNLPASETPSAQGLPLHAACKRPLATLSPSVQASAPSLPLPGQPAEDEEVGHGLPAHAPPHKDVVRRAEEASSSTDSTARLAVVLQYPSSGSALARMVNEATRRRSCAQRTPSEAASSGYGGSPSSAPTRSWEHHDCPPHLAQPPKAMGQHGSPIPDDRVRERSRARTHKEYNAGTHSQRCCPSSSNSSSVLELVEDAREILRTTAPLRQVSEERLLAGVWQPWTMGGAKMGELGEPRYVAISTPSQAVFASNAPSPLGSSLSPPSPLAPRAAWTRTRLRPSSIRNELASVDDVSTQRESGAQRAPWLKTFLTARLRQRRLSSC